MSLENLMELHQYLIERTTPTKHIKTVEQLITRPNDAKWISVMGLISIEPMFEPNTKLWWTDGVAVWMATYDSEELHKGTLGRYPTHFMSIEKPTPPKQSSEGEEG